MAVRQGCPLSPLIFIFAMQALSNCINFELRSGSLQGVHIPHLHLDYIQATYADDTHLTLAIDLANFFEAKGILQRFSDASGLHIQWAKSKAQ